MQCTSLSDQCKTRVVRVLYVWISDFRGTTIYKVQFFYMNVKSSYFEVQDSETLVIVRNMSWKYYLETEYKDAVKEKVLCVVPFQVIHHVLAVCLPQLLPDCLARPAQWRASGAPRRIALSDPLKSPLLTNSCVHCLTKDNRSVYVEN